MSEWKFQLEDSEDLQRAQAAMAKVRAKPPGFWGAALDKRAWNEVGQRAERIRRRASKFVVVGIGGSSLGAKALTALTPNAPIWYLDHTEPDSILRLRSEIGDLKQVHWLWISKSGNTLETLANLQAVSGWYKSVGLNLSEFSTVITEERPNPLFNWSERHKVERLPVPVDVGGRFSVLTAVGLLPAALAGVDLEALWEGVQAVEADSTPLAAIMAATLASWRRGEWTTLLWTYCDALKPFSQWFQQLWAESLAKAVDRQGRPAPRVSFPVPCVGALDQHSLLQQVMEGERDKWVWILRTDSFGAHEEPLMDIVTPETPWLKNRTLGQIFLAQAEGTAQALNRAGVRIVEWHWPRADAFHLGRALLSMEMVIASLGECLEIDAFNQPGVEQGKVLTIELLKKF